MSSATQPVLDLGKAWRSATRGSRRRVGIALLASVVVLALLGARHGTLQARVGSAATIAASVAFLLCWRGLRRAWLENPTRILKRLVGPVDRERSERALRALSLQLAGVVPPRDGTSPALVQLHVARSLAVLPTREVLERSSRVAGRIRIGATIVALLAAGVGIFRCRSLVEGADVLAARGNVAPLPMTWMDALEVSARPPEYLHMTEMQEPLGVPLVVPYGTTITVRGVVVRPGRTLLLSDGATEEAFVDDGSGSVVARWKVTRSRRLSVVARFGDVIIPQSDGLDMVSIADEAPVVHLEGAPRQLRLVDSVEDIPIRFEASDDHGLREVHLVLRSGVREERRVLARLDEETKSFVGGSVVKLRDEFLTKSHGPVTITVEANDNDSLSGPKWGASEAITVIPPDVGEPEALRLDALRRWRDALVDTLAWRLASEDDLDGDEGSRDAQARRRTTAAESVKRADDDATLLSQTLAATYGGIRVTPRIRSVLYAQQRATRKAVVAEAAAPSKRTHAAAVKATERFVLVTDAVVRGLGVRDTRASARQLADVADDLADAAEQVQDRTPELRSRAATRMDAAGGVLTAGGISMTRLGSMGRDLGEIVGVDLVRVKRARDAHDAMHAELAARDLAARLRQPDPSFDSQGGASAGGAAESGGGAQGSPGDDSEPLDDVEQAFNEAVRDLQRLAQEHERGIGKVEEALGASSGEDDTNRFREEAKRHAENVREAARRLPTVGMGSDSWTSKGAAARELAEQMARALEDGRGDEAAESGRSAVGSLDEAMRMLEHGGWFEDPNGQRQREIEDARRKLDKEARWADEARAELRRRASERARAQLQQGGEDEERLAQRAGALAQKGRDDDAFPEKAVESIDNAERAAREAAGLLKQGDADRGLSKQREAQRALEAAEDEMQGDDEGGGANDGVGRQVSPRDRVAIPNADDHKGPAAFRSRVLHGLGEPGSPLLRDAVKRYAEGLLR